MRLTALCLIAALGGCTATSQPVGPLPDPPGTYRALGTEPFWSLTIDADVMRFEEAGGRQVTVARPVERPQANGHRYAGARMTVDVAHTACSDGMSDRRYPDTVAVTVDGRSFTGCGGTAVDAGTLAGTTWTIATIDGAAVVGDRPATLAFTADRISGSVGCNRLSGPYRVETGRLIVGAMAGTRMLCEPAVMAREQRLLALAEGPLTIEPRADGSVALTGSAGGVVMLTPAR